MVFRFDDYSARSSTDTELSIIDAFRKVDAPMTLGVIPFVCDGDARDPSPQATIPLPSMKQAILKRGSADGVLDIALHGYSHQTIEGGRTTEFAGRDFKSQLQRLSKGKEFLEQIIDAPVTTFMPPWNSYDLNTIRALEETGFSVLSADMTGEAPRGSALRYLPTTSELHQLREALGAARSSSAAQPLVVVLFHEYDFKEIDETRGHTTIEEFLDLLHWLKSQRDVRLLTIRDAIRVIEDLSADRLMMNRRSYRLALLLPASLRRDSIARTYHELGGSPTAALALKAGGFYVAIVAIAAAVFFVMGMLVFPRSAFLSKAATFGGLVASLGILIYSFRNLRVHMRGMMASALAVGAAAGLWAAYLYCRKSTLSDRARVQRQH